VARSEHPNSSIAGSYTHHRSAFFDESASIAEPQVFNKSPEHQTSFPNRRVFAATLQTRTACHQFCADANRHERPETSQSTMPTLNDQQLAELLDEVGSAIEHSIPITAALGRVAEQQHGSTAKIVQKLLTSVQQGASLEESFQKLNFADEGQITAAIQAAAQTGKPDLLYRFAETLRSRHDTRQILRLNWFYPCVLTVLAYVLFVNSLAPLVRDNQMLITQWPDAVVSASFWIESWWWAPPCIASAFFVALLVLLKRQRMPTPLSHSLFYSTLASQLASDVPETQAIHTAALMAGEVELWQTENASFDTPRMAQLLGPQRDRYLTQNEDRSETTAMASASAIDTNWSKISRRAQLQHLAFTSEQKARRRDKLIHQFLPHAVSFSLGFIFIVSTACLFIAPIYGQIAQW
jgi:hypothetical protein